MKGQQRRNWEQIDLWLPDKCLEAPRKLDPEIRKEVTKLLALPLAERAPGEAVTKEASDEQDQR